MQWGRSLLSIGGDNLQFYPNFFLFSTLGGMNLDHDFVQVWKFSEDQKKANGTLFSPNSVEDQKQQQKKVDKFDVLRGRLLGNHNDFHWQLGGQINHQPCSYKAARVKDGQSWTALFRAFSSHRQPSASLTKLFPSWTRLLAELDKP